MTKYFDPATYVICVFGLIVLFCITLIFYDVLIDEPQKDRLLNSFCPSGFIEQEGHYEPDRYFCDGLEFICNFKDKNCFFIKGFSNG